MKVLHSWLGEFAADLLEHDPAVLAEHLSDLGLSVEEMVTLGAAFDGIVVAKVLALRPHPDADRIQLVDVDDGTGNPRQVCCGAFNMQVGDLVPLATEGAVVAGGLKIKRRKLRGEWSEGMLCSAEELELPDSSEDGEDPGILILPSTAELGNDVAEALALEHDVLFDLEVNPNRPDAMSVAGVARDLAARLGVPFAIPVPEVAEVGEAAEQVTITIEEPDFCRHFTVRTMRYVKVASSPVWLARRLLALGMRPVNSIVDISNFVMLELGQPSHAFDLDCINRNTLAVRMAKDGEQLETLDGETRTLSAQDGLIVGSQDEPLSLAGVMGGASTEISEATKTALIEAAWWDPMTISRTSRRLGLRSEASARFERGVDPEIAELALLRFAELAAQTGTASLAPGTVIAKGSEPANLPVRVRADRVNAMLGTELAGKEMVGLLEPMGFEVGGSDGEGGESDDASGIEAVKQSDRAGDASATNSASGTAKAEQGDGAGGKKAILSVSIPSWRLDCATEIDIVEEVGRAYGYSRIAKVVPLFDQRGGLSPSQQLRRKTADMLVGMGLSEVVSLPFLAPEDLRDEDRSDAIVVTNPLVSEESVMRQSLREGMAKIAAYNHARRIADARFFEIGHVFSAEFAGVFAGEGGASETGGLSAAKTPAEGPEGKDSDGKEGRREDGLEGKGAEDERLGGRGAEGGSLPQESEHLGVLLCGAEAGEAVEVWLKLCRSLGVTSASVRNSEQPGLHPTRSGELLISGSEGSHKAASAVGVIGEIDPQVLEQHDIPAPVAYFEANLSRVLEAVEHQDTPPYAAPTKFPSSDIDLAFAVSDQMPAGDLKAVLTEAAGECLASIVLFDIFRGKKLGEGTRSLAFRLRFEAPDRTLTDEEVSNARQRCIEAAQTAGASLREV